MLVDYFDRNHAIDRLDEDFTSSIAHQQNLGPATLLIAMIYIDRLKHSQKGDVKSFRQFNPSELYLSAVILATKYLNDAGM
jgi:hypothetical protein